MPWRTFLFLFVLAAVVIFAALNMHNATNISFGFYLFENVPIFVSLFAAFLGGTLFMLPLVLRKREKKAAKRPKGKKQEIPDDTTPNLS